MSAREMLSFSPHKIRLLVIVLPVLVVLVGAILLSQTSQASGQPNPEGTGPGHTIYIPSISRPAATLKSLVTKVSLTLPRPLAGAVNSWCTWAWCTITPRLYHEPLAGGGALVGWTDSSGNGHVSVISAANHLTQTFDYAGHSIRGLVAHSDGTFATLRYDSGSTIMWLSKYNANGAQVWATNIKGSLTRFDDDIGDSRLAYGNGIYGAYFSVYGVSGWVQGHNGDQLTYVNSSGAVQSGGREWGCSHSMAALINYHPSLAKFMPVCSSDCYASKGILIDDSQVAYPCDGNCGGLVSAQLGQVAQAASAWKLVYSAMDRPGFPGKGIGLATINSSFQSSTVWLTNTSGTYEQDPVIARLGTTIGSDRYLVGWRTSNNGNFYLGVIAGDGSFKFPLELVSSGGITWGNRDDSLRTRSDGKVSWVQGSPTSTTLNYYVFDGSSFAK